MELEELVVSTRNPSKGVQIGDLLKGLPLLILTLDSAGVKGDAVEAGTTLKENATIKARFGWQPGRYSIADDTGIFIDALGGQPGIHSARWAGKVSTEEIMRFTLAKLAAVPEGVRTATFKTAAVIIDPNGKHHVFTGGVRGTILAEPRTACQPMMPYSAIFVPEGHSKVWAEMSTEEENAISHRGQAFRQVRDFLEQALQQ